MTIANMINKQVVIDGTRGKGHHRGGGGGKVLST